MHFMYLPLLQLYIHTCYGRDRQPPRGHAAIPHVNGGDCALDLENQSRLPDLKAGLPQTRQRRSPRAQELETARGAGACRTPTTACSRWPAAASSKTQESSARLSRATRVAQSANVLRCRTTRVLPVAHAHPKVHFRNEVLDVPR